MGVSRSARVIVAAVALALPACQAVVGETPVPPSTAAPDESASDSKYAGAASCSATACHGSVDPHPSAAVQRDEYSRWVRHDRHATAYATLFSEKSKEMVRRLTGPGKPEMVPHEDRRCLACHASAPREQPQYRHDGVGCEACHGPAKDWLAEHTDAATWKKLPPGQRRKKGMTPLDDLDALARKCVGCHVGEPPDRDVNHDLIAAGHPRLAFDFGAYMANLPPHWNVKARDEMKPADYQARAWAFGVVVSAEHALDLLAHRATEATNGAPWPEFSEYGCYGCHQQLGHSAHGRGKPTWGTWGFPMLATLAEEAKVKLPSLAGVRGLMERPRPDAGAVAKAARTAVNALRASNPASPIKFASPATLQRLQGRVATLDDSAAWDDVARAYFAVAAIADARRRVENWSDERAGRVREAVHGLHGKLRFPPGQDGPKANRADADLRKALQALDR